MITLNDLNHFRSDNRVKFKTEVVDGQTVTIVTYMIADDTLWRQPLAEEVRGIVFDSNGKCISRPLHKFFNIGEKEHTQKSKLVFYNAHFMEKRDGSMLVPVLINDKIFWKSKKSFYSDVAIRANECATDNVIKLTNTLFSMGYTPIFEFTHPQHQIVIDYGDKPKFVLIAARHIETGEYLSPENQEVLCYAYNVDVIRRYGNNYYQMLDELETQVDFEGYVIRHTDGLWTKAKSKWYLTMHRIMTEIRERDVALAVVEENVDDLKSLVSSEGKDVSLIENIENRVNLDVESIIFNTEKLLTLIKQEPDRKSAAIKYCKDMYFKLAMTLYDGKEPRYIDYWKNNFWKQNYSLKVLYNQTFSGDTE